MLLVDVPHAIAGRRTRFGVALSLTLTSPERSFLTKRAIRSQPRRRFPGNLKPSPRNAKVDPPRRAAPASYYQVIRSRPFRGIAQNSLSPLGRTSTSSGEARLRAQFSEFVAKPKSFLPARLFGGRQNAKARVTRAYAINEASRVAFKRFSRFRQVEPFPQDRMRNKGGNLGAQARMVLVSRTHKNALPRLALGREDKMVLAVERDRTSAEPCFQDKRRLIDEWFGQPLQRMLRFAFPGTESAVEISFHIAHQNTARTTKAVTRVTQHCRAPQLILRGGSRLIFPGGSTA
jgi:hypothetical protein